MKKQGTATADKLDLSSVKLVIFDMDGVIADTGTGHRLAWQQYMNQYGRVFTDEEFYEIFGTGNKELCPILFPDKDLSDKDIERIGEEKEELFRKFAKETMSTYPGFFDFLNHCDEMGIVMAVGSSACRKNVDFILSELDIHHRFAATVSSDDVTNAKPAPDIFERAASLCGFSPSDALVLEDSLMGMKAAASAGMPVVALATTHDAGELQEANAVVSDFRELSSLFGF